MKNALYTITDEEFATLLERTNDAFEKSKIKYMLVGGTAVQSHLAKILCVGGKTITNLVESPDFRVQDYFRATDDIDLTLNRNGHGYDDVQLGQAILSVLDDIEGKKEGSGYGDHMSPTENHIVSIKLDRRGVSRPIFSLGLDGSPNSDKAVSFNIYKGPKDTNERWAAEIREFELLHYDEFMERRENVKIPFCSNKNLYWMVKNLEDLIATKVVRGREKDWADVLLLARQSELASKPINYSQVEKILCTPDKRYDKPNLAFVEKFEQFIKVKDSWKNPTSS